MYKDPSSLWGKEQNKINRVMRHRKKPQKTLRQYILQSKWWPKSHIVRVYSKCHYYPFWLLHEHSIKTQSKDSSSLCTLTIRLYSSFKIRQQSQHMAGKSFPIHPTVLAPQNFFWPMKEMLRMKQLTHSQETWDKYTCPRSKCWNAITEKEHCCGLDFESGDFCPF